MCLFYYSTTVQLEMWTYRDEQLCMMLVKLCSSTNYTVVLCPVYSWSKMIILDIVIYDIHMSKNQK